MTEHEWPMGRPQVAPVALVVDDEPNLVELVRKYLEAEGFVVATAYDGMSALDIARAQPPDLVILDVMLQVLDGLGVCRRIRQFSDVYVVMLTARSEEIDKIVGLSVGADDYVTKPFSPRELVARVKAMLRRPRGMGDATSESLITGPLVLESLEIDLESHEVRVHGEGVHLTPREFDLLAALSAHPGRVFTRNQLLERVWGDRYFDDHVVDVHVNNLRRKLGEDSEHPGFVETVRGVGYRFASPHTTRPLSPPEE